MCYVHSVHAIIKIDMNQVNKMLETIWKKREKQWAKITEKLTDSLEIALDTIKHILNNWEPKRNSSITESIKEKQFLPTIRTCEECRHQGKCIKEGCSRGLSRKDWYQPR